MHFSSSVFDSLQWKATHDAYIQSVISFLLLCGSSTISDTAQTSSPATPAASSAKAPAAVPALPTAAEIADAKSKGMVWANSNTRVYHKDDAFYGKTKHGRFMTEANAQKAGYKLAGSPAKRKPTAPAGPSK